MHLDSTHAASNATPPLPAAPVTLRTVDLRRAVFAVLLARSRPASLDDLVEQLEVGEHLDVVGHLRVSPRQRLADLLWWEIERGHVEHITPGRYRLIESSLTPSVRWRCEHWRQLVEQRQSPPPRSSHLG